MNRRAFVTGLGAVLAAPISAKAQPVKRMPRIAFLTTTAPGSSPTTDAFREGLRELGYVEDQNISIEWRW
jgi:putative ABC transport system substrate-binding protein